MKRSCQNDDNDGDHEHNNTVSLVAVVVGVKSKKTKTAPSSKLFWWTYNKARPSTFPLVIVVII